MPFQWVFEFWFYVVLYLLAITVTIVAIFLASFLFYWIVIFPLSVLYKILFKRETPKDAAQEEIQNIKAPDFSVYEHPDLGSYE